MTEQTIDRATIRTALRRLLHEDIYYILGEALEMLPLLKAEKLVKGYIDLSQFQGDSRKPKNILEETIEFRQASLRGDYYESFDVNWKNSTEKSIGTCAWIFEFSRLLECCVAAAKKENSHEIREAFDICFELLRQIDECNDDIIFFADEGGSWQAGVDWDKVFPAYFSCLAADVPPEEYANRVVSIVDTFEHQSRDRYLQRAQRKGNPLQRQALKLLLKNDI
jgi:hypothetical protein